MKTIARSYKVETAPDWSATKRDRGCDFVLRHWGHGVCSLCEGQPGGVKTKERAELLGLHWVVTGISPGTAERLSNTELLDGIEGANQKDDVL